jgi:hypothetical protein
MNYFGFTIKDGTIMSFNEKTDALNHFFMTTDQRAV